MAGCHCGSVDSRLWSPGWGVAKPWAAVVTKCSGLHLPALSSQPLAGCGSREEAELGGCPGFWLISDWDSERMSGASYPVRPFAFQGRGPYMWSCGCPLAP